MIVLVLKGLFVSIKEESKKYTGCPKKNWDPGNEASNQKMTGAKVS